MFGIPFGARVADRRRATSAQGYVCRGEPNRPRMGQIEENWRGPLPVPKRCNHDHSIIQHREFGIVSRPCATSLALCRKLNPATRRRQTWRLRSRRQHTATATCPFESRKLAANPNSHSSKTANHYRPLTAADAFEQFGSGQSFNDASP